MRGVILYGPPASGKSTITRLLEEGGDFVLFRRLKVGPGRTEGYRLTTEKHLAALRAAGDLLWENQRYGATYAVDRPGLDQALAESTAPVLHLGQPEAVDTVTSAYPSKTWLVVELWADRIETESRLKSRGAKDVEQRLTAWAETPRLGTAADLRIDTRHTPPPAAATSIRAACAPSADARHTR